MVEEGNEVMENSGTDFGASPSPSLMMIMGDVEAPALRLVEFDENYGKDANGENVLGDPRQYFVQAKVPASEDAVRKGARSISFAESAGEARNRRERRKGGGTTSVSQQIEWSEETYFLNKCEHQITDFLLLGMDVKTKQVKAVSFHDLTKDQRRETYRGWLRPQNRNFRGLLEDYLDWVAGRADGDDAAALDEEFAALGN